MTLYVDADACPVKAEAERVATRHKVPVKLVSNGGLRPSTNPLVEVVIVPEGPDMADLWIAERAGRGDVVVTNDMPLAARCVASGALVLRPDGSALTERNVGEALALRDLMTDLRAADPFRQGGAKGFGKADRVRFLDALERSLRAARA
ncbi:YaiI/YqxD family protein [Rhodosalinus sp. 5P4]|uniref:YaiI/YqxD family protein n=1 Tax=Rhodosalinus sp. 5P4 TaxID=3239196 RepID=UPI0035234B90